MVLERKKRNQTQVKEWTRCSKMAMPQRDDTIEAIKRLDALLEYAVVHGDEEEAERLREELRKLTDEA